MTAGWIGLTFVLHYLVVPVWLAILSWRPRRSLIQLAAHLSVTISWVLVLHLVGAGWQLFSVHSRWIVLAVSTALVVSVVYRHRDVPIRPEGWTPWVAVVLLTLFGALNWLALVEVAAGQRPADPPVALTWALPEGTSYVSHGGDTVAINHHHEVRAQRHALDVVQVYPLGHRARGIYPTELSKYAAFGTPVVAPCSGRVAVARDGLADLEPPQMDSDHLAGNHVVVHCDGISVVLAHLRQGSVEVVVGDDVAAGDRVGRVGNSGNTSEPHLHLHAVRGEHTDLDTLLFEGEGVPMQFDGRYLTRTDTVAAR